MRINKLANILCILIKFMFYKEINKFACCMLKFGAHLDTVLLLFAHNSNCFNHGLLRNRGAMHAL